mgnify:CR=1 FL=1
MADTAFRRDAEEVEKSESLRHPGSGKGGFESVLQGELRLIDSVKRLFHIRPRLCGQSGPSHSDHIQPADAIRVGDEHKGRHILADRGMSLSHAPIAEADKLMDSRPAPEKRPCPQMDMPSEHGAVGENIRAADLHIVSEVAADHQQIALAQDGIAALAGTAMDRNVLANQVATANDDTTHDPTVETQVLRVGTDDGSVTDLARLPESHTPYELGMTPDHTSRSHTNTRLHDGEWADFHILPKFRLRINDGSRMNFQKQDRPIRQIRVVNFFER